MLAIEHIINLLSFHFIPFWWKNHHTNSNNASRSNEKQPKSRWDDAVDGDDYGKRERERIKNETRWKGKDSTESKSIKMKISKARIKWKEVKRKQRLMIAWIFLHFSLFNRIKKLFCFYRIATHFNLISHYHTLKLIAFALCKKFLVPLCC